MPIAWRGRQVCCPSVPWLFSLFFVIGIQNIWGEQRGFYKELQNCVLQNSCHDLNASVTFICPMVMTVWLKIRILTFFVYNSKHKPLKTLLLFCFVYFFCENFLYSVHSWVHFFHVFENWHTNCVDYIYLILDLPILQKIWRTNFGNSFQSLISSTYIDTIIKDEKGLIHFLKS